MGLGSWKIAPTEPLWSKSLIGESSSWYVAIQQKPLPYILPLKPMVIVLPLGVSKVLFSKVELVQIALS